MTPQDHVAELFLDAAAKARRLARFGNIADDDRRRVDDVCIALVALAIDLSKPAVVVEAPDTQVEVEVSFTREFAGLPISMEDSNSTIQLPRAMAKL